MIEAYHLKIEITPEYLKKLKWLFLRRGTGRRRCSGAGVFLLLPSTWPPATFLPTTLPIHPNLLPFTSSFLAPTCLFKTNFCCCYCLKSQLVQNLSSDSMAPQISNPKQESSSLLKKMAHFLQIFWDFWRYSELCRYRRRHGNGERMAWRWRWYWWFCVSDMEETILTTYIFYYCVTDDDTNFSSLKQYLLQWVRCLGTMR